ncbi:Uncharacterised protein [Edwardsiella tarda]|nr:Uncharacterised protein [Edwardsiella tarda]
MTTVIIDQSGMPAGDAVIIPPDSQREPVIKNTFFFPDVEPTTPTPAVTARGLEIANAEFVAAKVAALVGSAPGVLDTLQEIAAALNNNPNFADEIINQLAGKQPLDSTLTALSGKGIAGIIQYLGLRETIGLAANAWSKNTVGSVRNGGTFGSCINPGIYSITIDDTSSVADIPRINNKPIYGYGFMIVTISGTAIEQLYISHPGHIATRQTWHGPERYNPWVVQYSSINKPSPEELGLGDSASKNIGSVSGTVAAGDDVRFSYPVGINQTWHSVTSERRIGVVYTNTYQKPIVVFAEIRPPIGNTAVIEIDGVIVSSTTSISDRVVPGGVSAIVPPGGRYIIKASYGSAPSLSVWSELF